MRGPRPLPTMLRLIRGDARPSRLRADTPKIGGIPELPPGAELSPAEKRVWDWLVSHVAVAGVHGTADGPMFMRVARLWCRAIEADDYISREGLVMRNPASGKPELHPYTRLSRDLWRSLGPALADIGASPIGRVRFAGPRNTGDLAGDADWHSID
jgi:hypothetical protein